MPAAVSRSSSISSPAGAMKSSITPSSVCRQSSGGFGCARSACSRSSWRTNSRKLPSASAAEPSGLPAGEALVHRHWRRPRAARSRGTGDRGRRSKLWRPVAGRPSSPRWRAVDAPADARLAPIHAWIASSSALPMREPARDDRLLQQLEHGARLEARRGHGEHGQQRLRDGIVRARRPAGDRVRNVARLRRVAEHRVDQRRRGLEVGRHDQDVGRARRMRTRRTARAAGPAAPRARASASGRRGLRCCDRRRRASTLPRARSVRSSIAFCTRASSVSPSLGAKPASSTTAALSSCEQQVDVRLRLPAPRGQQAVADFVMVGAAFRGEPGEPLAVDDLEPVFAAGVEHVEPQVDPLREAMQDVEIERRHGRQAEDVRGGRQPGARRCARAHLLHRVEEDHRRMAAGRCRGRRRCAATARPASARRPCARRRGCRSRPACRRATRRASPGGRSGSARAAPPCARRVRSASPRPRGAGSAASGGCAATNACSPKIPSTRQASTDVVKGDISATGTTCPICRHSHCARKENRTFAQMPKRSAAASSIRRRIAALGTMISSRANGDSGGVAIASRSASSRCSKRLENRICSMRGALPMKRSTLTAQPPDGCPRSEPRARGRNLAYGAKARSTTSFVIARTHSFSAAAVRASSLTSA